MAFGVDYNDQGVVGSFLNCTLELESGPNSLRYDLSGRFDVLTFYPASTWEPALEGSIFYFRLHFAVLSFLNLIMWVLEPFSLMKVLVSFFSFRIHHTSVFLQLPL